MFRLRIVQDPDWSEEIAVDVAKWNLLIPDTEGRAACIAAADSWNYLVAIANGTANKEDMQLVRNIAAIYRPELA